MALIAVTSAKGAPGVTTTCLGLALAWPRPVILVEADPFGGSAILAGYLRGSIAHDRGLIDVALAASLGEPLRDAVPEVLLPLPGNQQARLLPGIATAAQAGSLAALWEPLGQHLRDSHEHGIDVIVDAGRLGSHNGPDQLLQAADLVLLAVRSDLPSVAAARSRLPLLRADLDRAAGGGHTLNIVLIGPGRPYSAREVSAALTVPVVAEIGWDPKHAAVLSHGAPAGRGSNTLGRSLGSAVRALTVTLADRPALQRGPRP